MHFLNRRVEVEKEDIKKLCEERGITYKADFMDGLSEKQFNEGCIKLYIPADYKQNNVEPTEKYGYTCELTYKADHHRHLYIHYRD